MAASTSWARSWRERTEWAKQAMRLAELARRLSGMLSGGNKQRLALGCAMMHAPPCCSSTSPPPAWTRPRGGCSGPSSASCAAEGIDHHRDHALHGRGRALRPAGVPFARAPHRARHARPRSRRQFGPRRARSRTSSSRSRRRAREPRAAGRHHLEGIHPDAPRPGDARLMLAVPVIQLLHVRLRHPHRRAPPADGGVRPEPHAGEPRVRAALDATDNFRIKREVHSYDEALAAVGNGEARVGVRDSRPTSRAA